MCSKVHFIHPRLDINPPGTSLVPEEVSLKSKGMHRRQNTIETSFGQVYASLQRRVAERNALIGSFEEMCKVKPLQTGHVPVLTYVAEGAYDNNHPKHGYIPWSSETPAPACQLKVDSAVPCSIGIRRHTPVRMNRVARRRPGQSSPSKYACPKPSPYQAGGTEEFSSYIEQGVIDSTKRRRRGNYPRRHDEDEMKQLWADVEAALAYLERTCSQSLRGANDVTRYKEHGSNPNNLERSSTISECVMDGPALFRGHSCADLSPTPTLYVTMDDLPPRIRELLIQAAEISSPSLSRNNSGFSRSSRTLHGDVTRMYRAFLEDERINYFDHTDFSSDSLTCSPSASLPPGTCGRGLGIVPPLDNDRWVDRSR
ncbi:hypothetical protein BJ138DRAFT_1111252 [Hygrophoropsis aurantiaca]|uniref:Uncharacterized protein n=1 Tax=Hygrophoropsis aurantiaca TaxID=72124 RepID=A0ACB8AK14_9AGAM|nr:hypothetical protein BJ138DRAFT_1111252 [Hygrophoropsis aurantiaca]